jgi:uncharacterized protein (DUF2147 family)
MNKVKFLFVLLFTFGFKSLCFSADEVAQIRSPIGYWKTIDDTDHSVRSIVEIFEKDQMLFGKIVQIFPHEGNKPNCDKCSGEFKDKPILGLQFMWELKKNAPMKYEGGKILDPQNGSIYKSKIELIDDGKKLNVRGYIGISLLGRSQEWLRTDKPK